MDENKITENYNEPIELKPRYFMVKCEGTVVFPSCINSFGLSDASAVSALMRAVEINSDVFFINKNALKSDIRVGTVARIKQLMKNMNGGLSVIAQGLTRMEIDKFVSDDPVEVTLNPYGEKDDEVYLLAEVAALKASVKRGMQSFPKLFDKEPDLSNLESFIGDMAQTLCDNVGEKQAILEMPRLSEQIEEIIGRIERRINIAAYQKEIESKVRRSIDKNQREYYLREQIKVLHGELGDDEEERETYREKIESKGLPEYAKEKAEKELAKLSKMPSASPESAVSRGYLDLILDLPWTEKTDSEIDIEYARQVLDEDHYGLEKVKERIVEFLAVHALKKDMKAPVLCLVGPPGVGKTSVVKSIARAARRKFVTMSLGGVRDEAEIRGHRRTYIGSLPGRILSGMRDVGVIDPVFLLDEIDKMSADFRGDPSSALLEVLDVNQNDHFKDHYLEMPYDLSKVMFITTANSVETIDPPLLDRMEVIEISGYTYDEKLQIAKRYLIAKQCEANGVDKARISFTDEALLRIIRRYTRESGVRNLEREIGSVIRKVAVKLVGGAKSRKFNITENNLKKYLGKEKYSEEVCDGKDEVGAVTGLAWTYVGGTTLEVEATLLHGGKGDVRLTGNLGDVMKESAQTALSLVRARADRYNIDLRAFNDCDIHIHVPEGATPKDGPSAGITMATAILSAMTNRAVASDVAMTGEITLRGKVLPIGGRKEKSLAALRYGKKRLIIPKGNLKDLDEIPTEVKDNMKIIPVSEIEEVFTNALR